MHARTVVARLAWTVPLAVMLGACAPAERVAPAELQEWLVGRADQPRVTDSLGQASGLTGRGDAEPVEGPMVSPTFPSPVQVDGVQLACFGGGTLDFTVYVTTEIGDGTTQAEVSEYQDQQCGQDTDVPLTDDGVTEIGFAATGAGGGGAWSAEPYGSAMALP